MATIALWTGIIAFFGWLLIVRPALAVTLSPERDMLRIKRDFEGQGRVVIDVQRTGTDWGPQLHSPIYRRYAVTVRRQDGATGTFTVGVRFGLTADGDLEEHDLKERRAFFRGATETF